MDVQNTLNLWTAEIKLSISQVRCPLWKCKILGNSLTRGPKLLSIKNYVNQLTDDEQTTGYYQQDGATCHTSNASMRETESFFKTELSQKTFGHPDLPI